MILFILCVFAVMTVGLTIGESFHPDWKIDDNQYIKNRIIHSAYSVHEQYYGFAPPVWPHFVVMTGFVIAMVCVVLVNIQVSNKRGVV